jgi:CcmD family protein
MSPVRPRLLLVLAATFALAVVGAPAGAQDGGDAAPTEAPTGRMAAEPPGSNPGPIEPAVAAPPAGAGTASYHSPMRTACEDELAQDPDWFANLKARLSEQINRNVHVDAARYASQNNKHVVAAYAVFWVLTAGFVLLMWRRQRGLQAELTRLERELGRALKEGGVP